MGKVSARGRVVAACALISWLTYAVPAYAVSEVADLEGIEAAFVDLAKKVSPSVVAINTRLSKENKDDAPKARAPMVGSGVIIRTDGLIATNDHVIRDAGQIFVTVHGGERFVASVVGRDARSDLAVIRIDAHNLTPIEWGDLANVQVGQWALAMGNPFGLAKDGRLGLSYGIISALGKSLRSLEEDGKKYYGNLIQTTADINPGNSGGPLFNIKGQLVGINTAIETHSGVSEGLGFAIPICARTRKIIDALASGEQVEYGFLGVNIVEASHEVRRLAGAGNRWGVIVTRVFANSPAGLADVREDDLILQFDATHIKDADHLIRLVGGTPVGETVPLVVYRNGGSLTLDVTIGKRALRLAGGSE